MKFSELTIDMFRMLQALEREPVNLATQTTKPGTLVREDSCTLPTSITVECSLSSLFPLSFSSLWHTHFLRLSFLSFSRSPVKSQPSERTLTNTFYTNPPSANFTPSFRLPSRWAHISCTHNLYSWCLCSCCLQKWPSQIYSNLYPILESIQIPFSRFSYVFNLK